MIMLLKLIFILVVCPIAFVLSFAATCLEWIAEHLIGWSAAIIAKASR